MPTYSELMERPKMALPGEEFSPLWRGHKSALVVPKVAAESFANGQKVLLTTKICEENQEIFPADIISVIDVKYTDLFNISADTIDALGHGTAYDVAREISTNYGPHDDTGSDKCFRIVTFKPTKEALVIDGLGALICDEMHKHADVEPTNVRFNYSVFADFKTGQLVRNCNFDFNSAVDQDALEPFLSWLDQITINHCETFVLSDDEEHDEGAHYVDTDDDGPEYDLGITFVGQEDDDDDDEEEHEDNDEYGEGLNTHKTIRVTIFDHPKNVVRALNRLSRKEPDKFRALRL